MSGDMIVGKQSKRKNKLFKIIHILFLFLFVFQPEISSISIMHFLTMYLLIFIAYNRIKFDSSVIVIDRRLFAYFKPFVPFFVYVMFEYFILAFIDSSHSDIIVRNLIIIFLTLFRAVLSIVYLKDLMDYYHVTADDIINEFIIVGMIQTVCVAAAFISPEIRNFFNGLTMKYADSVYILNALSHDIWRSYGFAGNIFDAFGYETAFIIVLAFAKGLYDSRMSRIIGSVVMMIMPLLNARTGLFLCLIGFGITLALVKKKLTVKNMTRTIVGIVLALMLLPQLYGMLPNMTRAWIEVGFNATVKLLTTGEKTSAYSKILDQNAVFPQDSILFGKGGDPLDFINLGIESGYVQCIWRFGIVGTVLLLVGYATMFMKLFLHTKNSMYKAVIGSYAVIFFVYLIKLFSVYNVGATIMLIGIPITFIYAEFRNGRGIGR